ncbi:MAG: LeuD/DmdB family oxidoreductase small subunit [Anaerolineae bacterium]
MSQTFAQKALARAAGLDHVEIGQIVDVRPDIVLSHDNTAAIARLFRSLGYARVKHPERLAIFLDHAVPAPNAEHALNHKEVREFVAEQGIAHFYEAGRGICHQVASEEALVLPGQLILGADSHTTHFGWLGAFGAGVGRSEMAAIWATGELWLRVPETIRVDLIGSLQPGVTAKDLGLWLLKLLGPEAGIYRAIEIGGPGLRTLSIESRMVLSNLLAESGAKNAYLEPDAAVFAWLASRLAKKDEASGTYSGPVDINEAKHPERSAAESKGAERSSGQAASFDSIRRTTPDSAQDAHAIVTQNIQAWRDHLAAGALYPDPDAAYIARYTVDLAMLEPAIAVPHNPANVVPLSDVAGTRIHQAFIGTCTNGRLEDLAAAAAVLRRPDGSVRHVAAGTRLVVIPASSQVLEQALKLGYIETFVAAGALIGVPGCGPCMGNHLGVPASGETVISSGNRNFRGRMGNPEAAVYLASPAVVAASAVLGRIPNLEELQNQRSNETANQRMAKGRTTNGELHQETARPTNQRVSQFRKDAAEHTIRNTQYATHNTHHAPSDVEHQTSNLFTGRVWKYGDNVNTDVIFPGKYTYTVKDEAEMAKHALEDLDPTFAANVRPGDIIVAGRNWGTGSSREQAVTCLKAAGVRVIVAASFARIFFRNAVNNGVLPVVCPEAIPAIQHGEAITVDLGRCVVRCAAGEFPFQPFSPSVQRIIEAGGLLEMLRRVTREA